MTNEERLTAAGWRNAPREYEMTPYRWTRDGIDWFTEDEAFHEVMSAETERLTKERDEARDKATEYQALSDEYQEAYEHWRPRAEAAEALAESRPAITPQVAAVYKAADCAVQIDDISVPGATDAAIIIDSALREHARKVKP